MAKGSVIQVTSSDQFQNEISKNIITIVDFSATWCGPCKQIAPIFEKLAGQYPNLNFLKVDVDDLEEVAADCGISAMPTFQVYKDGKKIEEMIGATPDKLETLVKKYI